MEITVPVQVQKSSACFNPITQKTSKKAAITTLIQLLFIEQHLRFYSFPHKNKKTACIHGIPPPQCSHLSQADKSPERYRRMISSRAFVPPCPEDISCASSLGPGRLQ